MENLPLPETQEQIRVESLRIAVSCWPPESGIDPQKVLDAAEDFFSWIQTGQRREPKLKVVK